VNNNYDTNVGSKYHEEITEHSHRCVSKGKVTAKTFSSIKGWNYQ